MALPDASIVATQERQNVRAIVELEALARSRVTAINRSIDRVAAMAAHPAFIVVHVVWFAGWIAYNVAEPAFDPFPFSLLTLVVSLEAILLTAFLLISQNRMTADAERRAHLDLQINLLAEQELTSILRILCRLSEHAGIDVSGDPNLSELQHATNVAEIADLLDREQGDHGPEECGPAPDRTP